MFVIYLAILEQKPTTLTVSFPLAVLLAPCQKKMPPSVKFQTGITDEGLML